MKESTLSKRVESYLEQLNRKYTNVQGSTNGKNNGDPDIITMDKEGKFLGIELKVFNGKCYPNQYRQAKRILENKGRVFILFPDVFLEHLSEELPLKKVRFEDEHMQTPQYSHELIL